MKKFLKNHYFIIFIIATIIFIVRMMVFYKEFPFYFLIASYPISLLTLIFLWKEILLTHHILDKIIPYQPKDMFWRVSLECLIELILGLIYVNFVFWLNAHVFQFIEIDKKLQVSAYIVILLLTLLVNAGFVGNYYFILWKKAILKAEKLEKEKAIIQKERATLQYLNLQNQLNPHFLFNSITSLNSLIYENQDLASDFLKQLAKVYRYVLQNKDKELVCLDVELNFIENYLSLLKTRFGESFTYQIEITLDAKQQMIVPVTLQVLVENAIKHNAMTLEKPMQLKIFNENGSLVIQNNLQKKMIVEHSNKIGLENLKNLYKYLSEKKIEIIESHRLFAVKIPLIDD